MDRTRNQRGRQASRIARIALTLTAALALLAAAAPATFAAHSGAQHRRSHRIKRVCKTSRPRAASCLALRLLPATSSPAATPATAAVAARANTRRLVTYKEPEPDFLTPQLLHNAYNLPTETAADSLQTIALVDAYNDPTVEADLAVYDSEFHLPACTTANGCFRKVNQEGNASPLPANNGGWAVEISIDVQMAHAICNTCKILLVEAEGESFSQLGAGVNAAVKDGATEVSNSYGASETSELESYGAKYFNHPGVVVTAASGDCGYIDYLCATKLEPAAASFPADSPDVVAVGGTSLREAGGGWTSTAWSEGGSGCSHIFSAQLWQLHLAEFPATGCVGARSVADVSAIGDPETGVDMYDSTPEEPRAPTGWGVWGGTSVASPIVAAEFALAGGAHGVAYPAQTVYGYLGDSSALYDVTSGENGTCAGATACKAVVGYDGPTGLGSPLGISAFATPGAPVGQGAPVIAGISEVGSTLTFTPGSWAGSPTSIADQWELCNGLGGGCSAIAGATGSSLLLTSADAGGTIRIQETAANSSGGGVEQSSAASDAIPSSVVSMSGFTPSSGITGSAVIISGSALGQVTSVSFGTLSASFKALSSTTLEAIVPNGAKKGKVTITGPEGSISTKAKFTPTLSVTGISPASGTVGKQISIKGVGFAAGVTVSFGGVQATSVGLSSSKKLKVVVPAGALSGPVTVTNTQAPAGSVQSASSFAVN